MTEFWTAFLMGTLCGMVVASVLAALVAAQFIRMCREEVYDQGYQHGLAQGANRERIKRHLTYLGEKLDLREGA